jgi:hypothetical protein
MGRSGYQNIWNLVLIPKMQTCLSDKILQNTFQKKVPKNRGFGYNFYQDLAAELQISVNAHLKENKFSHYLVTSALFWVPKLISAWEVMQIMRNVFFFFDLRILLPIQIQLLEIENPKKNDSPYC